MLDARNSKVGHDLSRMDRQRPVERLDLYQQGPFDDQIDAIRLVEGSTLVDYCYRFLTLEAKSSLGKLSAQTFFVDAFEQTRPELAVNLDTRRDDHFGQGPRFRRFHAVESVANSLSCAENRLAAREPKIHARTTPDLPISL